MNTQQLTQAQRKAILILGDYPGISARMFAQYMWPYSRMHTKSHNGGTGAQRGKSAWLCAGSYLAKLRKKGLVRDDYFLSMAHESHAYYLLAKGKALYDHLQDEESEGDFASIDAKNKLRETRDIDRRIHQALAQIKLRGRDDRMKILFRELGEDVVSDIANGFIGRDGPHPTQISTQGE